MNQLDQANASIESRQPIALEIIQYPHPLLTEKSLPVITDIVTDNELQGLLDNMAHTMKIANAVGLAAVQVGVLVRALVVREVADPHARVYKIINPRIVAQSSVTERQREGCLSFIGLFIMVTRPSFVKIEYLDERGVLQEVSSNTLLGRAILHEMDHLDGKTFLDRLSNVERSQVLQKNKIVKRRIKAVRKAFGEKL